jgi:hypothetical protein
VEGLPDNVGCCDSFLWIMGKPRRCCDKIQIPHTLEAGMTPIYPIFYRQTCALRTEPNGAKEADRVSCPTSQYIVLGSRKANINLPHLTSKILEPRQTPKTQYGTVQLTLEILCSCCVPKDL